RSVITSGALRSRRATTRTRRCALAGGDLHQTGAMPLPRNAPETTIPRPAGKQSSPPWSGPHPLPGHRCSRAQITRSASEWDLIARIVLAIITADACASGGGHGVVV